MPEALSTSVLKQTLEDISNLQEIIDSSHELNKTLKNSCFKNDERNQFIDKTKNLIEKLKNEVDRINTNFGEQCTCNEHEEATASVSVHSENVNGQSVTAESDEDNAETEVPVESDEDNANASQEIGVTAENDGHDDKASEEAEVTVSNGNLDEQNTEHSLENENETLHEESVQSNIDKSNLDIRKDDSNSEVSQMVADLKNDEVVNKEDDEESESLEASAEDTAKTEESHTTSEDKNEDNCKSIDDNESKPVWTIKCVDINKLINPELLAKSATVKDNAHDESVVVLSDSDGEKEPNKLDNLRHNNEILVKQIVKHSNDILVKQIQKNRNITVTRQNKSVIVLDDSDSSGDMVLSEMRKSKTLVKNPLVDSNAKVQDESKKKRKSVRFNITEDELSKKKMSRCQLRSKKAKKYVYSSSDDSDDEDYGVVKGKQKKRKPKEIAANVSSFSDTNSDSDTDTNADNCRKISRKRCSSAKSQLEYFQSDEKLSWKTYVSLTKIEAAKLLENYKKRLLKDDINKLTNLDSLKRSRRAAKGSQSSDSADSVTVKKQRLKESNNNNKKQPAHSSSSDKSESEAEPVESIDTSALPEEVQEQCKQTHEANKEDNLITAVLEGIHSESELSTHDDNSNVVNSDAENATAKKRTENEEKGESKSDDEEKKEKEHESDKNTSEAENEGALNPEDPKKDKSWRNNKLLTEKLSESDSDENFEKFLQRKKKLADAQRTGKRKARIISSDSDASNKKVSSDEQQSDKESHSSDSNVESQENQNKKRRRIRTEQSDSSDEEKSTRRNIRKVWANDSLAETTKQAEKEEQERKARIADRQKKYNSIYNVDELQKAKVDKIILDFNEETEEALLQVNKKIVKHMKPHQAKGVQFMWTACFESLERSKSTKGSGCILAHCMGLGKTLQVIALVHTVLLKAEDTGVHKVLIVTPVNTVLNWVAEFKKWLPSADEVDVYELVSVKQNYERQYELQQWSKHGGVLIIGYDMFRNLTNPTSKRLPKKMRNIFQTTLVDPGPDLVVCDEGHLLKNEKTSLSVAMNRLRTLRRIVLTGTPLQNNLKEYFCMVQFVKPNLLGTYKEYLNRFVNPITNGQYTDSTQHDIHLMRKRSHVLHKLLDGIVQRRDYSVLAPFLPPKHEYILFINLTEVQKKLYEHYLREGAQKKTSGKGKSYLFIDFQEFLRICTHPKVLTLARKKKDILDDVDEDSEGSLKDFIDDKEDSTSSSSSGSSNSGSGNESDVNIISGSENENSETKTKPKRLTRATADHIAVESDKDEPDPSEWWNQYCQNDEFESLNYSGKLFLLFEILHECELMGDKILVFSQSLNSLDIIEYFLRKVDEATQAGGNTSAVGGHPGSWSLGLDYFRLDGSSSCDNRANWCKIFNDPENTRARLFLISTRAGGLGINLVAANRVIIFDVSWNPSHDIQSIYRVYRFGQTKPCYIYRFVTLGTMEMKIYERQVIKQAISKRVIDEQQIDRHYNQNDLAELYKFEPVPEEERPIPLVPKDILLGELLQKFSERIYKYHEHQSLLENKEEECLNEDERKAAWEEFENEKKIRQFPNVLNNIPIQTVLLALTSIIRKDNPTWDNAAVQSVVPQLVKELEQQLQFGNMSMYNRVLSEVRLMENAKQQQRLQDYYYKQQQALMFKQYQMMRQGGLQYPTGAPAFNSRIFNPGPSTALPVSSEVIDLND